MTPRRRLSMAPYPLLHFEIGGSLKVRLHSASGRLVSFCDMRIHCLTSLALLCGLSAASQPHLSPRFQTVFILSMPDSLDQHLASRLTSGHVLWVVLQPASADAVLTESLAEDFWSWLDRTYPQPAGTPADYRNLANQSGYPPTARRRGTIFLVDPRKRIVLWSTYDLPRNSSPSELDRTAGRITNQLRMAFKK